VPKHSQRSIARGRWVIPVAAVFVAVLTIASVQVAAQRAVPTAPVLVPPLAPVPHLPTGAGGALAPTMPDFTPAPAVVLPSPVAPAVPAPAAVPPAPVPLIRFRCQVTPGDSTCREQAPPDAGGSDESCDCAKDFCYSDPAGPRFCEKS
jgi:hypothetical protein